MKRIDRTEVLGLADYEAIRDRFRARVVAEKKLRRVELGTKASALFENRDTVLLQIQEMLRTERITRPAAVDHEIETYNDNIPGDDELSCTVMIAIEDRAEREEFLQRAVGFEHHVWLVAGSSRIQARASDRDRGARDAQRTTAVHYLKFPLPADVAAALRGVAGGGAVPEVALKVDHPFYTVTAALPKQTIFLLGEDLES
jgi:hypothetical protein